jgi:hypothetical protein
MQRTQHEGDQSARLHCNHHKNMTSCLKQLKLTNKAATCKITNFALVIMANFLDKITTNNTIIVNQENVKVIKTHLTIGEYYLIS